MCHNSGLLSKLFRTAAPVLALTVFLAWGGSAVAGDREDARALVGSWEYQGFLGSDFELKADGTYLRSGLTGEWEVKDGKLVIKTFLGTTKSDFTLTPDNNTLKWGGETYKRK